MPATRPVTRARTRMAVIGKRLPYPCSSTTTPAAPTSPPAMPSNNGLPKTALAASMLLRSAGVA